MGAWWLQEIGRRTKEKKKRGRTRMDGVVGFVSS